jgi:hypothetical protein
MTLTTALTRDGGAIERYRLEFFRLTVFDGEVKWVADLQ